MINKIGRVKAAKTIDFMETELPDLKEGEARVKIEASMICGSDLHIFKDRHPSVKLPVTIGHEFSGMVLETGKNVEKIKKGDRVVVEPSVICGTCEACRHGNYGYCENISFTYRCGDGAMAKYFTGQADRMYLLPDTISCEKGALTEPLAVAVHGVKRAALTLGDTVAVIGAGAIGIMVAVICKRLGAKTVIISDYSKYRLEMARELGIDRTVLASEENLTDVVKDYSRGKGFKKAFECVGLEAALHQAIECVCANGLVTIVGIFEKPQIQIDASLFVKKELRIQGSQGYCWDFEDALQLLQEIPFEKLITHRYPLEQLEDAIRVAGDISKNSIKVCINP